VIGRIFSGSRKQQLDPVGQVIAVVAVLLDIFVVVNKPKIKHTPGKFPPIFNIIGESKVEAKAKISAEKSLACQVAEHLSARYIFRIRKRRPARGLDQNVNPAQEMPIYIGSPGGRNGAKPSSISSASDVQNAGIQLDSE